MNFKQQTKKSVVKRLAIKLGKSSGKFTQEDLETVLGNITFDLININLTAKKSYVGIKGVGYAPIGFVNGFDKETKTFDVVVFENKVQAVEKLGDIVITARAFTTKEGNITKITGLDIEPVEELEG